jgi:DegV family protein with EDD domain
VVLAAATVAASGESLPQVVETAQNIMPRVNLFAMLDTLHYLVKGGRVPKAAALANSLLKIKPIFTLGQGDAHTVTLPRSIHSAIKRMLKMMRQRTIKGQPLHISVMHANAPDEAIALSNRVVSQFDCAELFTTEFIPVMGTHTGPGLIGVAFYGEDY